VTPDGPAAASSAAAPDPPRLATPAGDGSLGIGSLKGDALP
jgi:hypothetical protein